MSYKRTSDYFPVKLCIAFVISAFVLISAAVSSQEDLSKPKEAADSKKVFVPTFIEAKFEVSPRVFVTDENITLEGVIAFDQAINVHWDEFTLERLDFKPFKTLKVNIGPQRPFNRLDKFFADYRSVQILLVPPETAKNGINKISDFKVTYSYFGEKGIVKKSFSVGPFAVTKAPIKISTFFSPDVLHLGEKAELAVKIEREKNVKVLNQFLGVLKDDTAAESDKTEIRRFVASLEARKESAFNLAAPDLKPFKLLSKSAVEVDRPNSVVSIYNYRVAYYGAVRPLLTLPIVKIWYVSRKTDGAYQDPEFLSSPEIRVSIISRLMGGDRRLDGPQLLLGKVFGFGRSYYFSYALLAPGFLILLISFVLFFKNRDVKSEKKIVKSKLLSFKRASKELNAYVKTLPYQHGGTNLAPLGEVPINELRRNVFRVIGSVLNMTQEEADASTADELIYILDRRFGRVHIFLIADFLTFLDRAMSIISSNVEGIEIHRNFITGVMPFLTKEELWLSFSQI